MMMIFIALLFASVAPVFELAGLAQMYKTVKTCLEHLGIEVDVCVHTSRLKLRLFSVIPNLRATSQGRNVMLSFDDDDSSGALQKACYNSDGCKKRNADIIPQSLLAFINTILKGPSIKHQSHLINTVISRLSVKQTQPL